MKRKYVSLSVYLKDDQVSGVSSLSDKTGVPQARIVRDGIDLVLERYNVPRLSGSSLERLRAENNVALLIEDIQSRRALNALWSSIDEEVKAEIRESWVQILLTGHRR